MTAIKAPFKTAFLPRNARPIVEAKAHGKRPAHPVVVSFVGELPGWSNHHVFVDEGVSYDWEFLRGIDTYVAVKPGINAGKTIREILKVNPGERASYMPEIFLIDVERRKGVTVWDMGDPELFQYRWPEWQNRTFQWNS